MAAPIAATVPLAITDEMPVQLDPQSSPVLCCPFLDWQPVVVAAGAAAAPLVELDTAAMFRAFGARCSIGPLPADQAAARFINLLSLVINGPAWTRILLEFEASAVFAAPIADLRDLDRTIHDAQLVNPANLALGAADWLPAQPFVPVVPAAPAGRGRGRGRGGPANILNSACATFASHVCIG